MASIEIKAHSPGCRIDILVDGKQTLAEAAQEAVNLLTACLNGAASPTSPATTTETTNGSSNG